MQPRILTRFTTVIVFIFTCCLTVNVVANERELAPILSIDAWKLIADAEAYSQGFTPAIVSSSGLKPRTKNSKKELIKRPNSRVKVKFADELQVRLDVHSTPYSRTQQSVQSITELCEALGITLSPTIKRPHAEVDALIRKAERKSQKQQPDIGGIYWVNGDSMAVDVAAEMFFTMDEVEWVMYKPVFSMMPQEVPFDLPISNSILNSPPAQTTVAELFGACQMTGEFCENDISVFDCSNRGGTFLGNGSMCAPPKIRPTVQQPYYGDDRSGPEPSGACCIDADIVPDGSNETCEFLTPTECFNLFGVYQGDNVLCTINPCIGVCCMMGNCSDIVSPQSPQIDCTDLGGGYYGPGNACSDPFTCPIGNGECCLINGCVIVVDDAGCYFANGVFLGENTDDPPDPCGEGQTECPAGGGPSPDAYNICAELGDYISYLSGDCYLDQNLAPQSGRNPSLGCVDTELSLFFPSDPTIQISPQPLVPFSFSGDYIVVSGAPTDVITNVYDSECCEQIANDVPMCNTQTWGNVCASYANAYATLELEICRRTLGRFYQSPTFLSNPFGPIQAPITVQPRLNMENVGSGIIFMNNGALTNAMVEIVTDPLTPGSKTLNLFEDPGGLVLAMPLDNATDLDVLLTGIQGAGTGAWGVSSLAGSGNSSDTTFASELGTFPITACLNTPVSVFANQVLSGHLSPSGMPQIPKTVATPDYATSGLLAYMSPSTVPFPPGPFTPGQLEPLPSGAVTPWDPMNVPADVNKFVYLNQLLPWPMGGAIIGPTTYSPPLTPWWGGEGMDLFPDAPNPDGFGGQEIYKGSYGFGQFWEDDQETEAINGAYGNGVKIAVLDWSAHLQDPVSDVGINLGGIHEEFLAADNTTLRILLEGPATGHDYLELIFDENQVFGYSADHGSAVLGVLGARWNPASVPGDSLATRMLNNVGCLGLAPDATISFYPLATVTEPDREEQAWFNAIETLGSGDILCAAYRPVAVSADQPNQYYWDDTSTYMEIANNIGICTVIPAGDLGVDLTELEFPNGDQNAIVATAVSPGLPFKRWADGTRASNFTEGAQDYAIATVSGWGTGVTTCGKGQLRDNYLGYNTILYSDQTDAHVVHAQAYTSSFGFTGAAAAQVAGAAAQVQGFTKQVFGIPMGTLVCRQLIAGGKYEGTDRDFLPVLTPGETTTETGFSSECDETLGLVAWDFCPVDGGNLIGNLNNPRAAMVNVILNPIFDTPNIDSVMFIRGTLISGNIYSIAAIDGNLLIGNPVRTFAHQPYSVPANVPGGPVWYRGGGLTTDLYVTGVMSSPLPMNDELTISITMFDLQQTRVFLQTEMLDHRTGRWRRAGATTVLNQGDTAVTIEVDRASTFINPSNQEYHLRIITLESNPPIGGPTATYPIYYDHISLRAGVIQH